MEKEAENINIPTKEELKKLMENPGRVRGSSLKGESEYVLEKKGKEGLRAVEEKTRDLGYPIEYKSIKESEWYPVGLKVVSISTVLKVFNWGKKELAEMGESAPKVSFIVKLFMRHFISPEKIFKIGTGRIWQRSFNFGSIEPAEFHNDERKGGGGYFVIRVRNFKLHPLHCFYLGHFFIGVTKTTDARIQEATVKETKCMFKGDPYHEFIVKWTYK